MPTTLEQVRIFHETYGCPIHDKPHIADAALNKLRLDFLKEEIQELTDALNAADHVGVLDALTDIQYFLDGTYLALGYAQWKDAAFAEVQRSNMTKLTKDGKVLRSPEGKVMKSDQFQLPDLKKIMFPEIATKPSPVQPTKGKK